MKKKHISTLLICASLSLGAISLISCNDETLETETFEFEKDLYEVSSGDAVTVKGNPSGVTYSFQGGTPEGVTLDSSTGVITFDEELDTLPECRYIATRGDDQAITTIRFKTIEVVPTITFKNVSKYIVSGDAIRATAISDSGKEYAVSYSLETPVSGINIDATSGVVTYNDTVSDGTSFKVVATSKSATSTFDCIAMTEGIITSSTTSQIVEVNSGEDATFVLNFNGNTEGDSETTAENFRIAINDSIQEANSEYYSYDPSTKIVTIKSALLDTLGTGEIDIQALTQRNAVSLNLSIADKFIYTAEDFHTIFEPDYSGETPSFKEGSLDGYYVLGADVDLTSYLSEGGLGYNDGKGWLPIGAYSDGVYDVPFTGTFNGNGHTISGFFIDNSSLYVGGLFGRNQGTIENLKLVGEIRNIGSWSAALVGNNGDMGTIENIILDVSLANGGLYATGVAASTNWGSISNVISINENVTGYNDTEKPYQKAGIVVGLNETTGKLSNIYGISKDVDNVEGDFIYGLFGYSNNAEVTQENAGKLFASVDEMKAFDFSTILSNEDFLVASNELPTLKIQFTPSSAGLINIVNLPEYSFTGEGATFQINVEILPQELYDEFIDDVTYSVNGINGATVSETGLVDLTNATAGDNGGTLNIKATLISGNKTLEATGFVPVYDGFESIEMTNTETSIDEGDSLILTSSLTPNVNTADVTYVITDEGWQAKAFAKIEGNVLSINENISTSFTTIHIKAQAYGLESKEIELQINQFKDIKNGNNIHYEGDETDFSYSNISGTSIEYVEFDDIILDVGSYSFTDGVLSISNSTVTDTDVMHKIKVKTNEEDGLYRLYATKLSHEKYDLDWIKNAFGTDYIEIDSLETFKKYFPTDGTLPEDKVANLARDKVYVLTADIDFGGETIYPIGGIFDNENGIVNVTSYFSGQFYGLGHTISNYKIEGTDVGGLFAQIDAGGKVYDLNLENVNISSSYAVGALCGFLGGEGTVENVNVYSSNLMLGEALPETAGGANVHGIAGREWATPIFSTYHGSNLYL
ncbi:MAG: hypothetical protein IAC58_05215 [Firmicutes bacterium]|uniref:Peptidase M26 N-terminal domain-containing protein n=1 Tax=Candidatus Onthovivens merdipullorum TaxID=2840889 RepID=A0A9D9DJM2_9BACL|nr:hypothetical protein [Candidatus Onthovivens merdipullorum]